MSLLQGQCRQVDAKIEAIDKESVEQVFEIEDQITRDSVRTYREMQQHLETVTFGLTTTLK